MTAASYALKYDATPPALGALSVKPAQPESAPALEGARRRSLRPVLVRAPGAEGRGGERRLPWHGLCRRAMSTAGCAPGGTTSTGSPPPTRPANQASKTLEFLARGALLFPAPGERVNEPPLLVWEKVRGASYYNVILIRGRAVFSAWPLQRALAAAARLDLPRPALQAPSGHVQLVRVARTRRALGRTVREEARRQHVHLRRVGLGGNVRGHRLLLILGVCGLLLTPNAGGAVDVPGDPTPPVVTPLITGTLGTNGWYVSNVTVNWSVVDPESIILETQGCDARTLTTDTVGTPLTCYATERRRRNDGHGHDQDRQDGSHRHRHPRPRPRLERLVQPFAGGQLQRHRRHLRHRELRPAPDLLRPRQPERLRLRLLPRPGREHDRPLLLAQLRRDRAPGDRGERLSLPGPQRLVQPHADDHLRRQRRDVGYRHLHADDLLRPRQRERLCLGYLPRPGGEHERQQQLQLPVRRDRAVGDRDSFSQSRLERLVQPCADGRFHRHRPDLGDRLLRAAAGLLGA